MIYGKYIYYKNLFMLINQSYSHLPNYWSRLSKKYIFNPQSIVYSNCDKCPISTIHDTHISFSCLVPMADFEFLSAHLTSFLMLLMFKIWPIRVLQLALSMMWFWDILNLLVGIFIPYRYLKTKRNTIKLDLKVSPQMCAHTNN